MVIGYCKWRQAYILASELLVCLVIGLFSNIQVLSDRCPLIPHEMEVNGFLSRPKLNLKLL